MRQLPDLAAEAASGACRKAGDLDGEAPNARFGRTSQKPLSTG